jgi:hypothetical protein
MAAFAQTFAGVPAYAQGYPQAGFVQAPADFGFAQGYTQGYAPAYPQGYATVAAVPAEYPVAQAQVVQYAPVTQLQQTFSQVAPQAAGPFVPGPTTLAPTVVGTSFVNGDHHPKATVYAPVNPLRKFDFDRSRRAPVGASTQMVRTPTPADVATDPGSNTLANRLFDPWYPAAGNSRPYFGGMPYDWAGYWNGNSLIKGW